MTKFDDEFYVRSDETQVKQSDEQEVNDLLKMLKNGENLRSQLKDLIYLK